MMLLTEKTELLTGSGKSWETAQYILKYPEQDQIPLKENQAASVVHWNSVIFLDHLPPSLQSTGKYSNATPSVDWSFFYGEGKIESLWTEKPRNRSIRKTHIKNNFSKNTVIPTLLHFAPRKLTARPSSARQDNKRYKWTQQAQDECPRHIDIRFPQETTKANHFTICSKLTSPIQIHRASNSLFDFILVRMSMKAKKARPLRRTSNIKDRDQWIFFKFDMKNKGN